MIYLKKISIYTIFSFVIGNISLIAQVGINTDQPLSDLDIKASESNVVMSMKDASDSRLFSIGNDGNMSTNSTSYGVKVDLRNDLADSNDHSLAIGYSEATAAEAGKGAIRYNPTGQVKTIEFSNSKAWVPLSEGKNRLFILAQNDGQTGYLSVDFGTGKGAGSTLGWKVVVDNTTSGAFDMRRSNFTAPREGMYAVSYTVVLENVKPNQPASPMKFELSISRKAADTSDRSIDGFKSLKTYLSGTGNSAMPNVCKTIFYLKPNDVLSFGYTIENFRDDALIYSDPSLNIITIVEM